MGLPNTICRPGLILVAAVAIAAGSACAGHGPLSTPLIVADTSGLPEAKATDKPARMLALTVPAGPLRRLRDTIVVRYVVDTSGSPDTRTFEVTRGHDGEYIKALQDAIAKMRYAPSEQGGRRVRSWTSMEMHPGVSGGPDFEVQFP